MRRQHEDRTAGEMPKQYAPHFEGEARFQFFDSPFEPGPAVFSVHFEPGARTRPHVHHRGQVMYFTAGTGIVADRQGRHTVHAGDVVTVAPDEWHWHGASPGTAASHFTVQMPGPEDIEWDVEEGDWAEGYR